MRAPKWWKPPDYSDLPAGLKRTLGHNVVLVILLLCLLVIATLADGGPFPEAWRNLF